MSRSKRTIEDLFKIQHEKKAQKLKEELENPKPKVELDEDSNSIKTSLRPRKVKNYCIKELAVDEDDKGKGNADDDDDFEFESSKKRKKIKRVGDTAPVKRTQLKEEDFEDIYEDEATAAAGEEIEQALDKIPKNKQQLKKLQETVQERIAYYKDLFIKEQQEMEKKKSRVAEGAIPIPADVRTFDFKKLAEVQIKEGGRPFDVIMMDPPWQLSSSQPSRGVAIAYSSLADDIIQKIPVPKLQTNGFIFIWTINAKYAITVKLMEQWGYQLVDEITWIKKTINGKIAKGHGFYLQHAKESCLIGVKGKIDDKFKTNICSDIIFSERRGQSQKPEEIYQTIEKLVPNGTYKGFRNILIL
jgi:mRNA (2'-O-methyladenosine-N6-)-methyltransferase